MQKNCFDLEKDTWDSMSYEDIYTRETNTAMILSAGHSMPVVLRYIKIPRNRKFL